MVEASSEALEICGATGDLAYQQVFRAVQALTRRGHLDIPVICVAKPDLTIDQLSARARESVAMHGGFDDKALNARIGRLSYVAGD